MSKMYHRLRRIFGLALLAVLIALPFIRVHGESALRFDVPQLKLYVLGSGIGMQDFFIVLIALIFLTFLTLLITTLFGRIWCGWLCPQTVLVDVTEFLEKRQKSGYPVKALLYPVGILVSGVISASMIGYFVSPYDAIPLLLAGGLPARIVAWSWAAVTVLLSLDLLFLRRRFCATVCPYAKMQGVLFDDRTMVVSFDPARAEECMHCDACVRACPVGIDIKQGSQIACIHCAECVDACTGRMKQRNKPSLVNYTFGFAGTRKTGFRINPFITGAITAASLGFLLYLFWSQAPFDVTVRPANAALPQLQSDHSVSNTYILTFRNLKHEDLEIALSARSSIGTLQISTHNITLQKNADMLKLPVTLTVQGMPGGVAQPIGITLDISAPGLRYHVVRTFSVVVQN